MKFIDANFIFGTNKSDEYPKTNLPEFAFTGRSNVGKSSFINNLVNRKKLAKISSNPGMTKAINFFSVDDKFILADLPGFGYAKISKTSRSEWKKMIYTYFEKRNELKFVTVLIDSRHDPMPIDLSLIEWLENHEKQYVIVLTKCDKITKSQAKDRVDEWKYLTSNCSFKVDVIPTSSHTGYGRDAFLAVLKKFL
ncbi:MAG: hypothetical protein A2X64_05760 [Ignavibacteria bacterium GWF2_33_9]|nr:MAG: hypothetical protein A2X64_05760 [Ignavibacteria bacterium GWF2_33_9]